MARSGTFANTLWRFGLPVLVAACQFSPAASEAVGTMTCATWLETADAARLALADSLVGTSPELLDSIRVEQHRSSVTDRDTLVRDVEASLTKNCEVWLPRTRPVGDVMDALYALPK